MHGIGFELPLQSWFDFKIPKTKIAPNYIATILNKEEISTFQQSAKIIWLGNLPIVEYYTKTKKGNSYEMANLIFHTKTTTHEIKLNKNHANWLLEILLLISVNNNKIYTLQELKNHYEQNNLEDFELFWFNKPMNTLSEFGLLKL